MLNHNSLLAHIRRTSARALQRGALQPIATETRFVESGGVTYLVRILTHLDKKHKAQSARATPAEQKPNPFLPYEDDLYVADIGDHHVCLLNKFNVLDDHILIVTRESEHQETLLTLRDFAALSICLGKIDGLAFYNGGRVAGASQAHKHLQLVPLPLHPDGPATPIEPLLPPMRETAGRVPGLDFRHLFIPLDASRLQSEREAAPYLFSAYRAALDALGLNALSKQDPNAAERQGGPYNLIATRRWLLLVPRSRECFETISVNALGFAGALLVKNQHEFQRLVACGPTRVLQFVGN